MNPFDPFAVPIVGDLINAARESCAQSRRDIANIRYGPADDILFDFRGVTYAFSVPMDVIVVDVPQIEAAKYYCLRMLLSGEAAAQK